MGEHATLSPSSSSRWMTCPGSVKLIEEAVLLFGEGTTSDPALKGTCLHDIAEKRLNECVILEDDMVWTDSNFEKQMVTSDDIEECVDPYVEYVQSLEGDLFVETKVVAHDQVWGTGDAIVIGDQKMVVCDLKTGFIGVNAEGNTQLLIYALGAHKRYGFMYDYKEIEVVISQGRTSHHSSYTYTVEEIEVFEYLMLAAIEAITETPDHLVPSEKGCQWCAAKTICPVLERMVEDEVAMEFRQMTLNQLADALTKVPMIKAWIKGVEDMVKQSLEKGDVMPGWKMVQGRKSRNWSSVEVAEKYFKNRVSKFQHTCFNLKLKSPAQMEKALKAEGVKIRGKVDFEKVVVHGFSAPTVVDMSDKRDALVYGDQAADDFKDVDVDS